MKTLGLVSKNAIVDHIQGLVSVFIANFNTVYRPRRKFEGTAVLIETEEREAFEAEHSWICHLADFHWAYVNENHMRLLRSPYVRQIAKIIESDHIDRPRQ